MQNEAFVTLLNDNRGENAQWMFVPGRNDGYPTFDYAALYAPDAPTNPVVDDDDDTFGWTNVPDTTAIPIMNTAWTAEAHGMTAPPTRSPWATTPTTQARCGSGSRRTVHRPSGGRSACFRPAFYPG
jgi:hypothetical protein